MRCENCTEYQEASSNHQRADRSAKTSLSSIGFAAFENLSKMFAALLDYFMVPAGERGALHLRGGHQCSFYSKSMLVVFGYSDEEQGVFCTRRVCSLHRRL